jgi:amidase
MQRRSVLKGGVALAAGLGGVAETAGAAEPTALTAMGAVRVAQGLAQREFSTENLLRSLGQRIDAIDRAGPAINSILAMNPDVLTLARELDRERRGGHLRGPLHGLPVLLKDNIATGDRMATTGGSLALAGQRAVRDAHLVDRLRQAGALVLGKTNLSEWANIRSTRSTSGWSGVGGLTRNPYALDRSTSGSSAGSAAALAAELAPLAVGTETDGSIVSPASICGLVGLKPTVGAVSRDGIIPISFSQDTAGPMARSVADAALLFQALQGVDEADPATAQAPAWAAAGSLKPQALKGARLGVARGYFTGFDEADALIEQAIDVLRAQGAVVIDPVDLPPVSYGEAELSVLLHEFKPGLATWLSTFMPKAPVQNLADVMRFNSAHRQREMAWFGQELFEQALALGTLDSPDYRQALAACQQGAREHGLDKVFKAHKLDALIAPTGSPAWLVDPVGGDHYGASFSTPAAVAGYPHLTVPAGLVRGLPVGLSFVGPAWSDWQLLSLGWGYEQASQARRAPRYRRRTVQAGGR